MKMLAAGWMALVVLTGCSLQGDARMKGGDPAGTLALQWLAEHECHSTAAGAPVWKCEFPTPEWVRVN